MNRLLRWTLRLYPRSWRDRYGAEIEALLEDKGATVTGRHSGSTEAIAA